MTALILVVDDVPANVKLLEAMLSNEYYDVITATDGFEAIKQVTAHKPDLILLDVMMPGMDGFEVCTRLKKDAEVSHIPVVMVTALSDVSDRVRGLEAGADDFISKPINDTALFARVKSLVRIKVLLDELRMRDKTGRQVGVLADDSNSFTADVTGAHMIVIDDDLVQSRNISEYFNSRYKVTTYTDPAEALENLKQHVQPDVIVVSTMLSDMDGLRLATQLKNIDHLRNVPIITLVDEQEQHLMLKGLELGINDYLHVPIELNEMEARLKTQIRRKKYQDALRANYQASVSLAVTDKLTGLYNRNFLDAHIQNIINQSLSNQKNFAIMMLDMDHFKSVNDTYGHDVGDEILRELSKRMVANVRSSDLVARVGGEEFMVLMPETTLHDAYMIADRMRNNIAQEPFAISHEVKAINKTISIGIAELNLSSDNASSLIKRADISLYEAKNGGRNRVCPVPKPPVIAPQQTVGGLFGGLRAMKSFSSDF
ncbi:MAG: PleD family two-component system response regulator [Alphaproteobacteria bacterium]|nr:MAG: PleD family two-component system response regulator [Alphaproteobacteria bacterium]